MNTIASRLQKYRIYLIVALSIIVFVGMVWILTIFLPPGIDWDVAYYPAARDLLYLRNPYQVEKFFNPVWVLFPILPLALLPPNIGRAVFFLLSMLGYGYAAYRFKAKPLALGAFLISPPVVHGLLNANVDWIPLLGFILPPQIGLFFVAVKPQVGFVVAIFWFFEAWRKGGWRETLRVFAPISIGLLLSFIVFGFFPLRFGSRLEVWWNASLWPMSIPVGLGLMAAALRKSDLRFAMGAAPCLSPFVLFHSWAGALLAIVMFKFETIAVVVGLWILVILRALTI